MSFWNRKEPSLVEQRSGATALVEKLCPIFRVLLTSS